MLWCWRCRMEVPMLDEEEFAIAAKLYQESAKSLTRGDEALLDYYNSLSDFKATIANAVMHHRISMYGPPCEHCGKPYRTDKASFCAACGYGKTK